MNGIRYLTWRAAGVLRWHLLRSLVLAFWGTLALFMLLCGNEMFGTPPLMTPRLHPSAELVGTWIGTTSTAVSLTIHEDNSVTGTLEGAEVTGGRIRNGRSWFGKLLKWNCDYFVEGRLSGHAFAAPLVIRGMALHGVVVKNNRPVFRLNLEKRERPNSSAPAAMNMTYEPERRSLHHRLYSHTPGGANGSHGSFIC